MRLPRIIIAILMLVVVIPFAGAPATTMAGAPGIVEVRPTGDSFHFMRVCGWKSYTNWGCVERGFPFGTSGGTYRTSQTWVAERGVYTDVHFDHTGAQRCDAPNGFVRIEISSRGSCSFTTPRR